MDVAKYVVAGICCGVVGLAVGAVAVTYYIGKGMFRNF